MWFLHSYSWLYTLHTPVKPFRPIHPYSGSYGVAAPILQTRECRTMSSHAWTNRFYKSKNPRRHDEYSGGVNLTLYNPSNPHSLKTISASSRQSREPSLSSDRDELQEFSLQRTHMKLSVQPEKETDDEYENDADDDIRPSSQQPSQPTDYGLEDDSLDEKKDGSSSNYQSDHNSWRRHTSLEEKRIDLKMLKEKIQNLELRHTMKYAQTFSGPEESSISIRFWLIKRPKKDKIYHSKDYSNLRSFCHQIESGPEGWTPHAKYKEAKRLLAIEEGNSCNHYRMEKNASEDLVALKDFLDRLLGDRVHRVHTSWLDWVKAKMASNESDNTILRWFTILKTQIGDETNDLAKIEVMLLFARLDEPMQQKIREQSSIQVTKHDLVALAKKLWPNLDREPKPSLPTHTRLTLSTSAQL